MVYYSASDDLVQPTVAASLSTSDNVRDYLRNVFVTVGLVITKVTQLL